MEVFEAVNNILEKKKISKREFATKLIALEPKSNRTGEIISESIVYSYLTGATAIKTYLIPYIAEVLDVPEQLLFEDTPQVRQKLIKYLAQNLTDTEKDQMQIAINKDGNAGIQNIIVELIKYAPEPMLRKIEQSLIDIKNTTSKF